MATTNRKENKKKSFKSVGWYFTIGNYFASTIKQKKIFQSAFEEILSSHEGLAESLFGEPTVTDTQKDLNSVPLRPPISEEMRKIVLDLNQYHLFDDSTTETIKEKPPGLCNEPLNRRPRSHTVNIRPKWNSIISAKVMKPQRFLNSFSTELASKREQLQRENEAKHQAVKQRLPKISKTTEDLIVRRTNLDDKLRIMKLCHVNGLQYNEQFVRTARRSYSDTPSSKTRQCKLNTRHLKRSQSWQPVCRTKQ